MQAFANKFPFNEGKCKQPRIRFNGSIMQFDPIQIKNNPIEVVDYAKNLRLYMSLVTSSGIIMFAKS